MQVHDLSAAQTGSLLVAAVVLGLLAVYRSSKTNAKSLRLPPGPPRLPLIGSILHLPTSLAWLTYAKWSRQYGEPR